MLDVNKMCIMTSKFIILLLKAPLYLRNFSYERMAKFRLQLASLMLISCI